MSPSAAIETPVLSFTEPNRTGEIDFVPQGTNKACKTWYALWGELSSSAVPLVVLHGGPGMPSQYLKPLSLIHKNYGIPTLLYDQVGCGKSTRLPETKGDESFWTFELFIAELTNLLKKLGISQYHIFGHSWGGMVAVKYALTQPPGLRKLILCGSPSSVAMRMECSRELKKQLTPDVQEVLARCEREGKTDSDEYRVANMVYTQNFLIRVDPIPSDFMEAITSWIQDNTVSKTLYNGTPFQLKGPMKDYDVRGEVHRIQPDTAPGGVLLMNGKYDGAQDVVVQPFFDKITAKVRWKKFQGSSHSAFWEEPENFISTLGQFLMSD